MDMRLLHASQREIRRDQVRDGKNLGRLPVDATLGALPTLLEAVHAL